MQDSLRTIPADEFARRLKASSEEADVRFAFFLGAGCSRSSGIPTAGDLVKNRWLPRLHFLSAPDRLSGDVTTWAKTQFPDYDPNNAAASYGPVMAQLLLHPGERQSEIERLCEGKFPHFGYATLAQLVARDGGDFNVVLTTNFDDLVADSFYLFTDNRPLVIQHESLSEYIRPTRTRPLLVKLHGDHQLAPLNTTEETQELKANINRAVQSLLHDRGLVFMGYGGGDQGILRMLTELSLEALPYGVYWVSRQQPQGAAREWLDSRDAIWVEYDDFDRFMVLLRSAFDLPSPNERRFDEVFRRYADEYMSLSNEIMSLSDTTPNASALKEAARRTDETFTGPWAAVLEADRLEDTDPDRADAIYRAGIESFRDSVALLGSYAVFLQNVLKDDKRAEELYQRALGADPTDVNILSNYAGFLLAIGRLIDGLSLLDRAIPLINETDEAAVRTELWFYAFAHRPRAQRSNALHELRQLLEAGVRSPGWDLSANVKRASADAHPDAEWLGKLADVIAGNEDLAVLEGWLAWRNVDD